MFDSNLPNWMISELNPAELIVALYVRDHAGVRVVSPFIPPLDPPVLPAVAGPVGQSDWEAKWTSWWFVALERLRSGETYNDSAMDEAAAAAASFGVNCDEANQRAAEYKLKAMHDYSTKSREERLRVTILVERMRSDLGDRISDIQLKIATLPVFGQWRSLPLPELLLVSEQTSRDSDLFADVLRDVINGSLQ